jgi:hypothetical protein
VVDRFCPQESIVLGVAAATTLAMCVLAIATHRTLRVLGVVELSPQFGLLWVGVLLGATSISAQLAFHFQITKPAFAAVLLLNAGLAFLLLRKFQPEWLGFMLRLAFFRT